MTSRTPQQRRRLGLAVAVVGALLLAGCGTDPGAEPLPDPPPEDAPEHVKESWEEAFRSKVERLEAQDPRPDMKRVLDDLPLPGGLVLIEERLGVPFCFAGGCPYVLREYAAPMGWREACAQLEELVRTAWDVTDISANVYDNLRSCSIGGTDGTFDVAGHARPLVDYEVDRLPDDVPTDTQISVEIKRAVASRQDQ